MTMTLPQQIITIAAVVLATLCTRFLPFIIFPAGKETPQYIKYLGKVLPCAVTGLLVVYCFKSVSAADYPFGIPELIAAVLTAGLHIWKKNMLLSIAAGTVCYMLLVQFVFA